MVIPPHKKARVKKIKKGFFDYAIYPIVFFSIVVTIPQLISVWVDHNVAGVSLLTWGSYTVLSGLWMLYGVFKKQMPLIIGNLSICLLDAMIVVGLLVLS